MNLVHECGYRRVLFITKKKAIDSVIGDLHDSGLKFDVFKVINFEQLEKEVPVYDIYIVDEAHSCGAFAKPTLRTKVIKKLARMRPMVLMSGTPHPESPSQIFHQFWMSDYSPFVYTNFYKWAADYVNIKKKWVRGFSINDYSNAKADLITEFTKHYMVTLSQKEAGFTSNVLEEFLFVKIDERLYQLMAHLKKNKIYQMKNGDHIIADTPVKMQSVFHQLCSGTIIGENQTHVVDESKARFIKDKFSGKKIAIYYNFIAEGELLRRIFTNHTDNPEVFKNNDDVTFICQMISGREGVDLMTADCIVMYNIGFSATTYFQVRERMQNKNREQDCKIYWLMSERGIEYKIYKAVSNKKNYTLKFFEKDLHAW